MIIVFRQYEGNKYLPLGSLACCVADWVPFRDVWLQILAIGRFINKLV